MKILYIGDIMAEPGIQVVENILPDLLLQKQIDFVIAQAENVTFGKGISPTDFQRLKKVGVDFFSGGNHSLDQTDIISSLNDPAQPIIRPANYPKDTPGLGWKYADSRLGKVLVISLLGQVVGRSSKDEVDNPLTVIDEILQAQSDVDRAATVVNFHGDYSSEKVVIGHYLDSRVSAVVGDHWHIPTADARLLPGGTAHITDVGMCGALNSSLGVKYEVIIERWRDQKQNRNELETSGPRQFNAVLIDCDTSTGLSTSIESINLVLPI